MTQFLVKFKICIQVSPDDFEMQSKEDYLMMTQNCQPLNNGLLKTVNIQLWVDINGC